MGPVFGQGPNFFVGMGVTHFQPSQWQDQLKVFSTGPVANNFNNCLRIQFGGIRWRHYTARLPRTASFWNKLPYHIRGCSKLDQFKRHLKSHLFNIAYL